MKGVRVMIDREFGPFEIGDLVKLAGEPTSHPLRTVVGVNGGTVYYEFLGAGEKYAVDASCLRRITLSETEIETLAQSNQTSRIDGWTSFESCVGKTIEGISTKGSKLWVISFTDRTWTTVEAGFEPYTEKRAVELESAKPKLQVWDTSLLDQLVELRIITQEECSGLESLMQRRLDEYQATFNTAILKRLLDQNRTPEREKD
jgi:hypothetical protein